MVTDYGPSFNLRTISLSVVQDLTNLSMLKFLGVSYPIDGCAGRTGVQLRSADATVLSTCRFF